MRMKRFFWVMIGVLVAAALVIAGVWGYNVLQGRSTVQKQLVNGLSIELPEYYAAGMVLQRDRSLKISGAIARQNNQHADTGAGIQMQVKLERDGEQPVAVDAHINGDSFEVTLPAMSGSVTGGTLLFLVNNTVVKKISPVYVGDVFLAAGQSNMEMNYNQYFSTPTLRTRNMGESYTLANLPHLVNDPSIHFLVCTRSASLSHYPLIEQNRDGWLTATAQNSEYLGYLPQLFAAQLTKKDPNIPVGIIQTAWGGTTIDRHLKGGDIYNSHIAPLKGMQLAGILWYQGCNDAKLLDDALQYESNFVALINEYRDVFGNKSLPFLYVQLARYSGNAYTQYVRQGQLQALRSPGLNNTHNVAMTVSIDTDKGTSVMVHPLGKDIIAMRMASQWEAMHAGESMANMPSGPLAISMEQLGKGKAAINFAPGTALGLQTRKPIYSTAASTQHVSEPTSQPVQGVKVADSYGHFVEADAQISGSQLIVSSNQISNISQVSYLWDIDPQSSSLLYNGEDLPASPFVLGQ